MDGRFDVGSRCLKADDSFQELTWDQNELVARGLAGIWWEDSLFHSTYPAERAILLANLVNRSDSMEFPCAAQA